jgi:hypothetical protein
LRKVIMNFFFNFLQIWHSKQPPKPPTHIGACESATTKGVILPVD